MALWILKPRSDLLEGDNPWQPWYDRTFGFVVRAATAREAREVAQESGKCGCECRITWDAGKVSSIATPWLDPKYSTCQRIHEEGSPAVILVDHHAA